MMTMDMLPLQRIAGFRMIPFERGKDNTMFAVVGSFVDTGEKFHGVFDNVCCRWSDLTVSYTNGTTVRYNKLYVDTSIILRLIAEGGL